MVIAPDLPEYLPLITGNPNELTQVFQNLISNAVNYDSAKFPIRVVVDARVPVPSTENSGVPYRSSIRARNYAENIPRITARFYCVDKGRPFVVRVGMKGASNAPSRSVIWLA